MIFFQFRSELDPVAVYAAVVSTLTAALGLFQLLRSGPRLTGNASGDMKLYPDPSNGLYVNATINNRGTRRTTLTSVGYRTYSSQWDKFRGKTKQNFFIPTPLHVTLPKIIDAGETVVIGANQTSELFDLSKTSLLFFCVFIAIINGRWSFALGHSKNARHKR